ncbi:hypothetical protein HNP46_004327 [Pseudomonas nitritireducens]|uniref:Uncharacterized protein n=1 Tax=Pseudomonas nitroreducens TaxID=46680 RepID=A0A7W7P2C6_PSENT|nr:hypothetical protein [Pseudomonas nitritireducens]MBB4865446.1 hypothetical protein [Pseudomonas nitritireducens]
MARASRNEEVINDPTVVACLHSCSLPPEFLAAALATPKTEFGSIKFNQLVAWHPPYLLMLIEELGRNNQHANIGELNGHSRGSVLKQMEKLRTEAFCDIEFDRFYDPDTDSYQKMHRVNSWGIFNQKLYEHLRPYVRLVVKNWRESKLK